LASPLARQYYFIWLFFPMTVLFHRAAYDPRRKVRLGTWLTLAAMGILMCLSLPMFPKDLQAYGNNLAATVVLAAGLIWHIRHPLKTDAAGSMPRAELQPGEPGPPQPHGN
jgi:4-amino-4-deoxy-L-arabinose transferase-like glycosyltransferase